MNTMISYNSIQTIFQVFAYIINHTLRHTPSGSRNSSFKLGCTLHGRTKCLVLSISSQERSSGLRSEDSVSLFIVAYFSVEFGQKYHHNELRPLDLFAWEFNFVRIVNYLGSYPLQIERECPKLPIIFFFRVSFLKWHKSITPTKCIAHHTVIIVLFLLCSWICFVFCTSNMSIWFFHSSNMTDTFIGETYAMKTLNL